MKLGTVVYDHEIYNLDYMTADEIMKLFNLVETAKKTNITQLKKTESE